MEQTHAINFSWLLTLRWGAAAGQIAIILIVNRLMRIELPLVALGAIIGIELASNAACALWARRAPEIREWMLGLLMMLDVLLLTALLYFTGGPSNPFSFLYLVNIALAAVVLRPAATWALVAGSLACFGLLFFTEVPLPSTAGTDSHTGHMWMHLQGMWVAFGVAASFIVYFIQRVTHALARREIELAVARARTARHEKLASLATLAAGAAHELATPLSTIAVVAKELERQLERGARNADEVADARLIRQQVERCREILSHLAADAGESAGETIGAVAVEELLTAAMSGVAERGRIAVAIDERARGQALYAPARALAQALRGVLKNALQASPPQAAVALRVVRAEDAWRIEVWDSGAGMPPEVLARAGEPFFTTKHDGGPQRGMGLGLFLTRAVLERLGGRLELDSAPGRGTSATMILRVGPAPAIGHVVEGAAHQLVVS